MRIDEKYISPLAMWLIVAAGVVLIFFILPKTLLIGSPFFSWLLLPAVLYWLYFFLGAIRVHKRAARSVAGIDKIIKEGVYARVRHPIYSADIVLAWGIFFWASELRFLLAAHWLMFVLLFWMRLEEKGLIEKFGQEYLDYKKQVPMVFPKLK